VVATNRIPRQAWGACLAVAALLAGTPAQAADEKLLEMLLQNGAITQEQHDELLQKEELSEEDVSEILVSVDQNGLRVRTSDGQFGMKLGGRLHTQVGGSHGPGASMATDGIELRRARLDLEATMFEDWLFKGEVDFADDGVRLHRPRLGQALRRPPEAALQPRPGDELERHALHRARHGRRPDRPLRRPRHRHPRRLLRR
jgi:hypothetical protein